MLVCDYCKHKIAKEDVRKIKIQVLYRPWEEAEKQLQRILESIYEVFSANGKDIDDNADGI